MSAQNPPQGVQPQAGPSTAYHGPVAPSIPAANLQALVLRLTHAIHDIDAFQNLLAAGAHNGTLPTWDNILERYTLLLSRVQALSTYIHRPPPQTATPHPTEPPSTDPILSKYLVHPLNPLAPVGTEQGDQINPIARDIFEWVLSTLPNPSLSAFETQLLAPGQRTDSQTAWMTMDELKGLSEQQANDLSKELRDRLMRESRRAEAMREEIERKEEEMDWEMRILEGDNDDDTIAEGQASAKTEAEGDAKPDVEGAKKEQEEDLFGDGEDDFVMMDGPATSTNKDAPKPTPKKPEEDPQERWRLADYITYMDTGRLPQVKVTQV
ncbi:hypothetical protein BD324DRAFT_612723 [Kockovaella imperatae]|uniref:Mediator of RNA polymerase II transcription subunit 8 n=1 Tax=Kockovaella imperatae TaxID=4999 RepID=A0A1Y1USG4_9TREE|nr:hypothetical protein BD324DRAFT_612723 [Kockovaella imperatae]ORX40968.1 hypothetical protein BD324DRAFT_612723 [Kockovaella imperatae]